MPLTKVLLLGLPDLDPHHRRAGLDPDLDPDQGPLHRQEVRHTAVAAAAAAAAAPGPLRGARGL